MQNCMSDFKMIDAMQQSNSRFFVPTPMLVQISNSDEDIMLSVEHPQYLRSQTAKQPQQAKKEHQRQLTDVDFDCSSSASLLTPQAARRGNISANITNFSTERVAGCAGTSRSIFGLGMNKDLAYYRIDVCENGQHVFVQRRFNDFYTLAQQLRRDFPGRNLPMPDKERLLTAFNSLHSAMKTTAHATEKEFREKRAKRLNEYVQFLIADPELRAHPKVMEFLGPHRPMNVKLSGDSVSSDDIILTTSTNDNTLTPPRSPSPTMPSDELGARLANQQQLSLGPTEQKHMRPDDFQFLKVIGRGNFGKVYQARMQHTNHVYAVKVLDKSRVNLTERDRNHVKTERDILLKNVEHPFLVGLRFSFHTKSKLYFVMDYINGGELFFHLQKSGFFSEELSCFYAAEIASALGYLHARNIIYRDLKPENLLLDAEGHIKLTDFGLCKKLISGQSSPPRTRTYCGTPEYLAPELIRTEPYGFEVDWWCLGAVTYEMVFSLPPWYSKDHRRMQIDILHAPLELDRRDRWVSGSCKKFLRELLVRLPNERLGHYGDFGEIARHPFFSRINWHDLEARRIPPPFKPRVLSQYDLTNIDPGFQSEVITESVITNGALRVRQTDSGYGGNNNTAHHNQSLLQVSVREINDGDSFAGFSYTPPMMPCDDADYNGDRH